jgi:hypothetical protein
VCPHCDTALAGLDEHERAKLANRRFVQRKQALLNQSFVALILFLGGFLYLYSREPAAESLEQMTTYGAIATGFVWYIINRIRIILLKKS